ncbi:hypothetical protein AYI68_g5854 [Smittium mucronatum]|uniref:UspA domain-containing protein n=1 Tax=Smittium mucronatum TaxID=133383 RepID=A0A1R0GT36_9FUNG|nr:hypothetical protein AYI68_g5854 [Smittium mucronatum]
MLVSRGISCSVDILVGNQYTASDLLSAHKANVVIAHPAEMSTIGKTLYLDWAETLSRSATCPITIARGNDIDDSILSQISF